MAVKPHFEFLKNKWTKRHKALQKKLWTKHGESLSWLSNNTRQLTAHTVMAGLMLLGNPLPRTQMLHSSERDFMEKREAKFPSPPTRLSERGRGSWVRGLHIPLPVPHQLLASENENKEIDKSTFLVSDLTSRLPEEIRPLTADEEKTIAEILSRDFGVKVTAEIDGKRLNRNYGFIGAEQHLARFPGDTMYTHFDSREESDLYSVSGMAPGRGAWGYFANSASEMKKLDREREKYYIAVQTFLAQDFLKRVAEYRDFFKFRKMLVVNPQTGRGVVAVIGDAGPAEWTGKHLGGSPEVMNYLERKDGSQKGGVLYFFVDDPDDKIPLGPIEVQ